MKEYCCHFNRSYIRPGFMCECTCAIVAAMVDALAVQVNGILETTGRKHGLQFEPSSLRTSVCCNHPLSSTLCDGPRRTQLWLALQFHRSSVAQDANHSLEAMLMQVSSQLSTAVSTPDGHSLVNSSKSYPWKGPAFLRYAAPLKLEVHLLSSRNASSNILRPWPKPSWLSTWLHQPIILSAWLS